MADQIKILVIDDSQRTQTLIKTILSKNPKLEVIQALRPSEGVQMLIENHDIKLVLIDIMMPEVTGLDLLRILVKSRRNNDFKTCIISAKNTSEYVEEALRIGCDDYIIKPFDVQRFYTKVMFYIGESENQEQTTTYNKKVDIECKLLDSAFLIPLKLQNITEYDFFFKSSVPFIEKKTMEVELSDNPIFKTKKSLHFIIRNQEKNKDHYIGRARIYNLIQEEEEELRSFIIKG